MTPHDLGDQRGSSLGSVPEGMVQAGARAVPIASGWCSQRVVLPSMSVNRNVTVPLGSSAMLTLRYRYDVEGTGYPVMIAALSSRGRLPESTHDTGTLHLIWLSSFCARNGRFWDTRLDLYGVPSCMCRVVSRNPVPQSSTLACRVQRIVRQTPSDSQPCSRFYP